MRQICKFPPEKNTATFNIFHYVDFVCETPDVFGGTAALPRRPLENRYHPRIGQLRRSASARSSSDGATAKGCPTLESSGMSAALSP